MQTVVRNFRVLWRAERLMAEMRLRVLVNQMGLLAVAALIAMFALAMANFAAYLFLAPRTGPVGAALLVALGDIVIAVILVVVARGLRPGPEIAMVEEVRDMALEELEAEAEAVQGELRELRNEIEGVAQSAVSFARNPLSAIGPDLIVSLLTSLTKLLRSGKS